MLNSDYREMLQILSEEKVRFMVVGAYALAAHGYPRATGDIDIWVEASSDNSQKIFKSLARFGAPLGGINEKDFENEIIFQIGIAPRRIDIITYIDGVDFQTAFEKKEMLNIDNLEIPVISINDLLKNKESTGREKDKIDAKMLKKKQKGV